MVCDVIDSVDDHLCGYHWHFPAVFFSLFFSVYLPTSVLTSCKFMLEKRICCLKSTEANRPIRGGDEWEIRTEEWIKTSRQAPTWKTKNAVDRHQNNKMLKAVSVRHCAATTAPRNCCPNYYSEQSHKDNVRSSADAKQLKQKKSNSQARLHLPALDLRVQLTFLLLISPGLCHAWKCLAVAGSAKPRLCHPVVSAKWLLNINCWTRTQDLPT